MSWLGDLSPTPNPREGNPHLGHDNLNSLPSKCLPAGAGGPVTRPCLGFYLLSLPYQLWGGLQDATH